MNNALALALRDAKQGQGFNLRKDDFEIKRDYYGLKREFRGAAVFLLLVFSFLAADMGVDYYYLKKRYTMLDQKITDVFKQTMPEVTRIVDPVQQLNVKINEKKRSAVSIPGINSNDKVLDLLRDISNRVPKALDVRVTRMVIDPESVRMSGKTDTFNTVDSIKNELEPSTYFSNVTISSANLDQTGKRVQFEIKLQRKK
jgi:general secretion pathway protein L